MNNMCTRLRLLMVVGLLGSAGCLSPPRETFVPPARPLGAAYPSAATTQADLPQTPAFITLEQALALALLHNPGLVAGSHGMGAARARARQARLAPNPEIEVAIEEYNRNGEGFDSSEVALVLSQQFEMGGKRRHRVNVAAAEGEMTGWDYESARLDVFSETRQRFSKALASQQELALAEAASEAVKQTHRAVEERVNAGKEPPLQASRAAAERERADLAVLEAKSDTAVARLRLAAMWAGNGEHIEGVEGDLENVLPALPAMDVLRPRLADNPELARADAELRVRETVLAAEKAARIPDLEAAVGVSFYQEDESDALAFGIGVPLPIFDRNQGNIASARHETEQARVELKAARTALEAELAESHAELTMAHAKVLALRSKALPTAEDAYEAAREAYRQGKYGFLDVLDAQRSVFDLKREMVAALTAYHSAIVAIERLATTSIEEMMKVKTEDE